MSKSISVYTIALAAFLSFALFVSYQTPSAEVQGLSSASHADQNIQTFDLNRPFDFAGEPLPMENFDVKERLEREILRNSYYHSNTLLLLKRAKRYFPTIERILAENGLPDDLKYLAVTESDLSMAVSPAGAKGIWQFMKAWKLIPKARRAKTYYDLNLSQETMRYFFRIVAIKEIMENPENFGFHLQDHEKYHG